MTRKYLIKYSSKSKAPKDEALTALVEEIKNVNLVDDAALSEDGTILTITTEDEANLIPIMDAVVNVFRRQDGKSEVTYDFAINFAD